MGKGTRDFAFAAAMLPSTAVGSPAKRLTAAHLCDVFRQAPVLRTQRVQRRSEPHIAAGGLQVRVLARRSTEPINSYQTTTIWVYVPVDGSPGTVHAAAQR
jgi:hypothetical protein